MPKVRHTIAASGAALLAALAGGCRTLEVLSLPDAGVLLAPDAGLDAPGDAAPPRLAVVRVLPGHGPFSGGNVATLRGNGLGSGPLSVRFGERSIPASDVRSIDSNRLEVTVPARSPGSVDVEVSDGTSTAVLPAGYTYDPVAISPASSSPDGGVVLTLRAASALFDASTAVRIDDLACTGWSARSPTEGTCVVPPHEIGTADVTVTSRGETLVLEEAFTYESPFRSFGGLVPAPEPHGARRHRDLRGRRRPRADGRVRVPPLFRSRRLRGHQLQVRLCVAEPRVPGDHRGRPELPPGGGWRSR
jgi:hypothetical protein